METTFNFTVIGYQLDETDIVIKMSDNTVEINEKLNEMCGYHETSTSVHQFDSISDRNHFIIMYLNKLKKSEFAIDRRVCEGWITGVCSMEVHKFNNLREKKKNAITC